MSRRNRLRERRETETSTNGRTGVRQARPDDDERHEARDLRGERHDDEEETMEDGGNMLGLAHLGARHPVTALAVTFGVGFGIGVLATAVLAGRREERWWEHGRLHDSMNEVSSRLKRVPSMIADHLPSSWTGR